MTFEEFQSTKTPCDDLRSLAGGDSDAPISGLLYWQDLYIENVGPEHTWAKEGDKYNLSLDNQTWSSPTLPELERRLYDWARDMGFWSCKCRDDGRGLCVDCREPI